MDLDYAGSAVKAFRRTNCADRSIERKGQCPVVERFPSRMTRDTCKLECARSDPRERQTAEIPDCLLSFEATGPVPAFAKLEHGREAIAPGLILMLNRHSSGIKPESGNRGYAGRWSLRLGRRAVDSRRRCCVCEVLIERGIRWHDMIMRVHNFNHSSYRNDANRWHCLVV